MGTTVVDMDQHTPRLDPDAVAVARAVTTALDAAGMSRLDASERTGIPRSTFYRKCEGLGKPFDVVELAAIASLLGMSASALLRTAERAA